jgi:hypothetical protein
MNVMIMAMIRLASATMAIDSCHEFFIAAMTVLIMRLFLFVPEIACLIGVLT